MRLFAQGTWCQARASGAPLSCDVKQPNFTLKREINIFGSSASLPFFLKKTNDHHTEDVCYMC